MSNESQEEDSVSSMLLEDIKNRLLSAFRAPSTQCQHPGSCTLSRNPRVDEELRRAKIDGAITWLRTELMEMRSQDRELAKTLLELNSEIQKLRSEQEWSKSLGSRSPPETPDLELQACGQQGEEVEQEMLFPQSRKKRDFMSS
ncbi:alanine- and arginine-rich domain-containing protein [Mustelus asterias]